MCVHQLLEKHTRTHLITDKAGGHIPDDEYKNNKHTDTKREDLSIFTGQYLDWGRRVGDGGS